MKRLQHIHEKLLLIILAVTAALISGSGCSYVADYIEGAITNRAGFSIDAYYDGTDVIVSWSESGSGDGFAGYEVYMTEEADNEFADYKVVGARYSIGSSDFNLDSTLEYAKSFEHSNHPSGGVYFYRVGIISWDKIDKDNDGDKDDYPDDTQTNYENKTSVSEISGSARVVIP